MRLNRQQLINDLRDELGPAMLEGLGAPSMMVAEMDSLSNEDLIEMAKDFPNIDINAYLFEDLEEER